MKYKPQGEGLKTTPEAIKSGKHEPSMLCHGSITIYKYASVRVPVSSGSISYPVLLDPNSKRGSISRRIRSPSLEEKPRLKSTYNKIVTSQLL
jgi:hypothetical protein